LVFGTNNKYIELKNSIDLEILPAPTADIVKLKVAESELATRIKTLKVVINNTGPILTKCPSCGQAVDNSHKAMMLEEAKRELPSLENLKKEASALVLLAEADLKRYNAAIFNTSEWEKYSALIDKNLPTELIEQVDVEADIATMEAVIKETMTAITKANDHNVTVETHNAKVQVILEQMESVQAESKDLSSQLEVVQARLNRLQILAKTFSPTGFIAYKIESLVKDLEKLTNEYLTDMSDGRFQIQFSVSSSDKLDVLVTDNGEDVDISDLSNGELARVNISTLLAIRSLMQSLSNVRSNLLILDETIENLDAYGKDKLVEVLLKEEALNTVLISHSFTHPLITKVEIVKEKRISRILE
jgi:DNA repair exonuclease SbcCD ATPase subunit